MDETLGILTVVFGLVLGLVYRHIMVQISTRENSLLEEIENLGSLLEESENSIRNFLEELPRAADLPDPMETMELMRAGILNNLMNLGVQWVGKKFDLNMGVHQIEDGGLGDVVQGFSELMGEEKP